MYWRPFDVSKKAPLSFIKKTPFESGRSESEDVSPSTLFPFDMVLKHHQLGASQLFKSLSQTYSRHGSSIDFDRRSGNSSTTEQDFEIHQMDGHNLLRPETIESVFILYRITGKEVYRDMGWTMFQAFEKYTRVETGGYTSLVSDSVRFTKEMNNSFFPTVRRSSSPSPAPGQNGEFLSW